MRFVVLIALACAAQASAAEDRGPALNRMAAQFKEEFKFDPEAAERERERLAALEDQGVILMATVHVRGEGRNKADKAVELDRSRVELEMFTWKNGGTIVRGKGGLLGPDLVFKYNPEHNGIDLLTFSW